MADSARWQQVQDLFEAALAASPEQQEELLRISGAEAGVVETVVRMLQADSAGGSVLDRGIPELASELLVQPENGAPQPPAEEFGPYRLVRFLGEGGMGVVWLARRKDTGGLVAVKFLPSAGLSPARLERFMREVRLLTRLKHPCIARLYDAGTLADGTPWFAMEYVEGSAFANSAQAIADLKKRLVLFRRVCEAVQYAHGQAIIHRDLKPSNILVEQDGTPKLLDFGIAHELAGREDEADLTMQGPRFMSKHYAAPEWIQQAEVGVTTDVYSLGVMLYEMVAGQLPDEQVGERAAAAVVKPSVAARKRGADAGISKSEWSDLDVLCLKAMHAEPAKRYGSAEALIRDINHFLKGEPLEARPDSWRYRSAKFMRRNALPVAASAAALALMAAMAAFFTIRLASARNAALAEAERANRVQQFTLSLFSGSGKVSDAPGHLSAETLVDRGAVKVEQLNQDPVLQADLEQKLGQMYEDIGALNKADRLDELALARWTALGEGHFDAAAESRIRLGLLRADENRAQEGERLVRETIAQIGRQAPKNRQLRASANAALGQVLVSEGKYAEGSAMLKQAAADQEAVGAPMTDWADTLAAYSDAELYLGHYDVTDAVNQRLLGIYQKQLGGSDPRIAASLQNLAETAEQRGDYSKAESYERQAMAITSTWYGKDHPETAGIMTTLASTLVFEKKYDEALKLQQ